MQSLQKELARLTEASKDGQLSERGKPEQFQGAYAEIVRGMNAMLDAILLPIGEGNRILAQISGGKIDELIAHTYKGDHEKMKLAVNNVGMVVQALQKEMMRLTEASKEGQLSERGKPEQFPGRVRRDRARRECHAGRDPAAHRRGQPHSGADFQRQDRRTDRPDLQGRSREDEAGGQQCRHGGAEAAEGTGAPDDASKEGQLSERGKPEQFQGAYAEIVRGVNAMLDAILLPIGEGNRILAQISSGKIDELIAQTYKGDHEKMKQAVNNVGMVLQGLQKELGRLTDAAKEGKLTERGDQDQFQGAYANIVRGRERDSGCGDHAAQRGRQLRGPHQQGRSCRRRSPTPITANSTPSRTT